MYRIVHNLVFTFVVFWIGFTFVSLSGNGFLGYDLSTAWASGPPSGRFTELIDRVDWEKSGQAVSKPNEFQIEFFQKLESFDQAYFQWQTQMKVNADLWESLANEVFGHYETMAPDGENGPYILRGKLIFGECLLFAAVDHMVSNQREAALRDYRKGIRILQKVILLEDVYRTLYGKQLALLPDYRKEQVFVYEENDRIIHPYAGYEAIGTGWQNGRFSYVRSVQGVSSGYHYSTIDMIQKELRVAWENYPLYYEQKHLRSNHDILSYSNNMVTFQRSTVGTARDLLSDFCPWGVELFFLLEKAGLTHELDFRILRPFAGRDPSVGEKFLSGLKQFPDAIMGTPLSSEEKIPPVISELVIDPAQVPKHIRDEMNRIVGDRQKGYLGPGNSRAIKWIWVEEKPTYNVWYFSPKIYDWSPSDYLWLWFTAVKIVFGDPVGVAVDEGLNAIRSVIGNYYGQGNSVYCLTHNLIEQYNEGLLYPKIYEKREWLDSPSVFRKTAGWAFGQLETQIKRLAYEGIDPEKFSLGKTYNGDNIPPIIIRSEVMGFEKVPEDEYLRYVLAVRFFLFFPGNIVKKGPYQQYDLSNVSLGGMSGLHRGEDYLAEQNRYRPDGNIDEPVRKLAWNKLPDPMNSFEVITDFTPKKQLLKFHLTEEASKSIPEEKVYAELGILGSENKRYARAVLKKGETEFSFELYNKNDQDAKDELERQLRPKAGMTGGSPNAEAMKKVGEAIRRQIEAQKRRETRFALVDIKSQYRLRLMANGKIISRSFKVILDRGWKNQRKVTGKIVSPVPGTVQLNYSPQVDIIKLKVKSEFLGQDNQQETEGTATER